MQRLFICWRQLKLLGQTSKFLQTQQAAQGRLALRARQTFQAPQALLLNQARIAQSLAIDLSQLAHNALIDRGQARNWLLFGHPQAAHN